MQPQFNPTHCVIQCITLSYSMQHIVSSNATHRISITAPSPSCFDACWVWYPGDNLDKYILQFWYKKLVIWTKTFYNLKKYIPRLFWCLLGDLYPGDLEADAHRHARAWHRLFHCLVLDLTTGHGYQLGHQVQPPINSYNLALDGLDGHLLFRPFRINIPPFF